MPADPKANDPHYLEHVWDSLSLRMLPANADSDTARMMRLAFFSGASVGLGRFTKSAEADRSRRLHEMHAEITRALQKKQGGDVPLDDR